MGSLSVDGPQGPQVQGTIETVGRFYAELATLLPQWQHGARHISQALAALNLSKQARLPLYRKHRSLLRNGQWRRVGGEPAALDPEGESNKALQTELNYLRRHGEAGRLSYVSFRRQGLPLGSGSIESSIVG